MRPFVPHSFEYIVEPLGAKLEVESPMLLFNACGSARRLYPGQVLIYQACACVLTAHMREHTAPYLSVPPSETVFISSVIKS